MKNGLPYEDNDGVVESCNTNYLFNDENDRIRGKTDIYYGSQLGEPNILDIIWLIWKINVQDKGLEDRVEQTTALFGSAPKALDMSYPTEQMKKLLPREQFI